MFILAYPLFVLFLLLFDVNLLLVCYSYFVPLYRATNKADNNEQEKNRANT